MSIQPIQKRFKLKATIVVVGLLGIAFLTLDYFSRSYRPNEVSSAKLERLAQRVNDGMSVDQVSRVFGFSPSRSELDDQGNGSVEWFFVINKYDFAKARCYFADFKNGRSLNGSIGVPL